MRLCSCYYPQKFEEFQQYIAKNIYNSKSKAIPETSRGGP
jgi:hypothetical protein